MVRVGESSTGILMASVGIHSLDDNLLLVQLTSDNDYRLYVYPYMLTNGSSLKFAGFWRDCNWMAILF